ncbi:MAG: glycoside hydrolase family 2, partial [Clostridia bacterium]|nr:glycoside hydrolase family 2 [Clostridia bacterium]
MRGNRMKMERKEYPRPQFRREAWQNLNGEWEFDFGEKDIRNLSLSRKINVPFSYQWEASGINDKTVHDIVWYCRTFKIEDANKGKRALLCFNASDYQTDVWINGCHVVTHVGGFTPFGADITDFLKDGENEIAVRCKDTLDTAVPRGKQSWTGEQFTCFYYPNSGIWQSVWIEFFETDCIDGYSLQSDIDNRRIYGYLETLYAKAEEAEITLKFRDRVIKKQRITLDGNRTKFSISLADNAFDFGELLWRVGCPNLIYVDFVLYRNGKPIDIAHTRIGLRKIGIDEHGKILLNDRPLFQKLILDQGYWKESGLTPPSAEALKKDIELARAMGFNGARKHQKLEDPYYYY